jgi:YjjI family glycine radical enzyme
MTNPPAMHPYEDFGSGLSAENVAVLKGHAARILRAPNLLGDQKKDALSDAAYKTQPYPGVSPAAEQAVMDGRICLLSEGPAPYHPRYVAPDYQRLLRHGSDFMGLQPAQNLYEATANLLAAYKYLPDGGHPVFIGRLDELLEPFLGSVTDKEARHILRSFWLLVDRLYPTAFVHANLGPGYTRVGELLFEIDREIKTITNLTFRYDPEITEKGYALDAVRNALALGKPYFLNHPMMEEDWGPDYVVASCYNVMRRQAGFSHW